jgi:superfamily II DNA/RNA helicase
VRNPTKYKKPPPPHLQRLFPPGALPFWWRVIAEGTPYQRLPEYPAQGFFCSDTALGSAAKALARSQSPDHPAMHSVLAWLGGSIRTRAPGQAMVVCGSAVEAMYVQELARVRRFETAVALMGHSHLGAKDRAEGFSLAHSGAASVVTATSVAERGVDLQSLRYLLVLNPPHDLRQAKQLLGRCGRNPLVPGSVAFAFAEGSSRERTARVLASQAARYGVDSPLRGALQERFPRKRKKGPPPGPGLFD